MTEHNPIAEIFDCAANWFAEDADKGADVPEPWKTLRPMLESAPAARALLEEAVIFWGDEFADPDNPIDGADLVDWFAEWMPRVQALIGPIPIRSVRQNRVGPREVARPRLISLTVLPSPRRVTGKCRNDNPAPAATGAGYRLAAVWAAPAMVVAAAIGHPHAMMSTALPVDALQKGGRMPYPIHSCHRCGGGGRTNGNCGHDRGGEKALQHVVSWGSWFSQVCIVTWYVQTKANFVALC